MARPFLSVIIPAYNEAKRLPLTLIDVDRHLASQEYSYEILVVDNASSDNTSEIVRRFIAVVKNLKLLNNTENRGKGAAVRIGMLSARGNWRLIMDADNSIKLSEFFNMMPHLMPSQGFDVVLGSSYVRGARTVTPMPLARRCVERLLNLFMRLVFKVKIKDFLRGFRCFSSNAAEKIFAVTALDGWSYEQESLVIADRLGYRIKEMPVESQYMAGSHFRIGRYLQMFWETLKIWWWLRRGKYSF